MALLRAAAYRDNGRGSYPVVGLTPSGKLLRRHAYGVYGPW